jgi:hypothetical protein
VFEKIKTITVPSVTRVAHIHSLMEPSTSWKAANSAATRRTSQHFMETEGSLPCSQEPFAGPYPQPEQSIKYHTTLSLSEPLEYYPLTYVLVFLVISFLLAFPPYMHSSSPPFLISYNILNLCDYRLCLDWWKDLFAIYTNDSEIHAIRAPLLISTIHKSAQHSLYLL